LFTKGRGGLRQGGWAKRERTGFRKAGRKRNKAQFPFKIENASETTHSRLPRQGARRAKGGGGGMLQRSKDQKNIRRHKGDTARKRTLSRVRNKNHSAITYALKTITHPTKFEAFLPKKGTEVTRTKLIEKETGR